MCVSRARKGSGLAAASVIDERKPFVGNRYTLVGLLGAGGMGQVYRAVDRLTGETVALKRVLTHALQPAGEAALRLALAHEFQALAGLRHPNIIGVRDYGFDTSGQPYFTMELLYNPRSLVAAGQFSAPAAKVSLLLPVLHALAYIHRRGVIHRDLKPGNILVSGSRVKVLDFGLAAIGGQQAPSSGTLRYMAPEVLRGAAATVAADLYAVGVLAYELLAGWHPFAPTGQAISPELLLTLEPDWSYVDIAPPLLAVLQRLLAKQPVDRYPDAAAVIAALGEATGQALAIETVATRESFLQAAPFVGRETELAQLTAALTQAVAGQGRAWLLGGESGVGKSRLLNELRTQALVQGVLVVRGQASSTGGGLYQIWQDLLRWLLLLAAPTDLDATVLKPLVYDIADLLGRPIADAPALEAKAAQTRLWSTIAALLQRATAQQPLLLLLEDLHWADENSLELLQWLTRPMEQANDQCTPLLLIGTYRRGEAPKLPERFPGVQSMILRRLLPVDIEALSIAMLGAGGQRPHLVTFLQQETEGNTFFIVETLRALAEEAGQLDRVAAMALPKQIFPGGIQQVVQRRLQRAPAAYQPLLRLAAVAGRRLALPLVQALAQGLDVEQWLTVCTNASILEWQDEHWQFSHDKLREGLLADLDQMQRQHHHRFVAETIERIFHNELATHYADLAYHYGQIGAQEPERRYARLAGEQAAAQYANEAALTYLQRALQLTPEIETGERYALLRASEAIYHMLGRRTEQQATLTEMAALSHALATDQTLAEVTLRQATYAEATGNFATAVASAQRVVDYAQQAGDQELVALGYLRWGVSLWRQGDYRTSEEPLLQALRLARTLQSRALEAESVNNLGTLNRLRGDYGQAQQYYEEALPLLRAVGNRRGERVVLLNLGVIHEQRGDYMIAQHFYEQSLHLAQQIGDRQGMGICLNNLGVVCDSQGKYSQALRYYEQALVIDREVNNRGGLGYLLNNLAFVFRSLGDYAAAERHAQEALTVRRAVGDRDGENETLAFLGLINCHQGQIELALTYCRQAWQIASALDARPSQAYVLTCLGRVLEAHTAWAEAEAVFQQSMEIRQEMGEVNRVMEARAGLARVAMATGRLDFARAQVQIILAHLTGHTVDGTEEPLLIYLTCYQVLAATADPTAARLLQQAQQQLQQRAAQIEEPHLRHSFGEKIDVHRTLAELWIAQSKGHDLVVPAVGNAFVRENSQEKESS